VDHGVDEFPLAGLTAIPGRVVNVPRVGESRAAMECKVTDIVRFRNQAGDNVDGWLVLGEVVAVYIDKLLLKDGVYQTAQAYPIMRAGGLNDYVQVTPENVFQIVRLTGAGSKEHHGA
jgi:flavin reductase (DIM6/NTAB) family NADH-FMN oxidoreductase RutF